MKALVKKIPALLTRASIVPHRASAVSTTAFAVAGRAMSPNDIAVLVTVVQFESFSRAAHALGMTVSTVSRKVTALEERLGATLLQRTTRKLNLTAQGRAYYNHCNEPLSHLFDAERVLTQ